MSMMVSFVLSFFPRDVLDEILNLIESVSEDFPSYSYLLTTLIFILWLIIMNPSLIYSQQTQKKIIFLPKTLQQGASYCICCHLLIAKGLGDQTGCKLADSFTTM